MQETACWLSRALQKRWAGAKTLNARRSQQRPGDGERKLGAMQQKVLAEDVSEEWKTCKCQHGSWNSISPLKRGQDLAGPEEHSEVGTLVFVGQRMLGQLYTGSCSMWFPFYRMHWDLVCSKQIFLCLLRPRIMSASVSWWHPSQAGPLHREGPFAQVNGSHLEEKLQITSVQHTVLGCFLCFHSPGQSPGL